LERNLVIGRWSLVIGRLSFVIGRWHWRKGVTFAAPEGAIHSARFRHA